METIGVAAGALALVGRAIKGTWVILKETAKETIGHLLTGKFWWNLLKRIGQVSAVAASEAVYSALNTALAEVKVRVRKAAGVQENDPVLRSVLGDPAGSQPLSRPYSAYGSSAPSRTYSPNPNYGGHMPAVQFPPTPQDPPGGFPGFR